MRPLEGVRELRERRMLSQQELADRAGVSLFTVQRIERGEGNVRPRTGRAVAAALGVSVEDLGPKVQPRLPDFNREPRPSAPVTYTAYEALGQVLATYWREDLQEWDEKLPPGDDELENSDQVWGLLAWITDVSQTKTAYTAVAREAGFLNRSEFRSTVEAMEGPYYEGLSKLARIIGRMKTDVEFHRIVQADERLKELRLNG